MAEHSGSVIAGALIGVLLGLVVPGNIARAQSGGEHLTAGSTPEAISNSSDPNGTASNATHGGPAISQPAGKTQDQFKPLTRKERLMESTEATCPHCGRVNQISGFSEVDAFVCRFCERGVGLE